MSRHRFVRNLVEEDYSHDYDDYDDYDEDEEEVPQMTEEETRLLRDTAKVAREQLKDDIPQLSEKELADTLWYYYFDVPKSVAYLRKQYNIKPTPKPKVKAQAPKQDCMGIFGRETVPLNTWVPFDDGMKGFFDDCPWGNIPEYRLATLIPTRIEPRGGLLGGQPTAGKPSKLAALAAKRKAAAERKAGEDSAGTQSASVALLSKLTPKTTLSVPGPQAPDTDAKSPPKTPVTEQRRPLNDADTGNENKPTPPPSLSETISVSSDMAVIVERNVIAPTMPPVEENENPPAEPTVFLPSLPILNSEPSAFASSLLGNDLTSGIMGHFADGVSLYISAAAGKIANAFVGPSPDDVVKDAQSKVKSFGGKPSTSGTQKSTGIEDSVQALNVQDRTADLERVAKTSKKLNVFDEYSKTKPKESSNFVVIGHVDAGKSTLMGRLLLDCGVVQERTVQKFKHEAEKMGKSSFALAWVLDQTEEERSRGVTIDIAMNSFETVNAKFTVLDAPGHKDFIPNMIAGASQADFAVLVIDASTGAFESGFHLRGQTKEHTLLVRSIGVQQLIVAINKLDTVAWSEERFREIQTQMITFFNAAGFLTKNVTFVPCSGLTGDNVVRKPKKGTIPWYDGETLLGCLEKSRPMSRAIEKPLRLTIADVFRGGVVNPVSISGRIDAGSLQVGDIIAIMPSGEKGAIKSIELNDEPAPWAVAGNNVTLHLAGVDMIHIRPGDIACDPDQRIKLVTSFTAKILAFETITPMFVDIHRGRLHVSGRVASMIATLDKSTGAVIKKKPRHIPPGSAASVRIELVGGALPLETGVKVIFRAGGQTVASGIVE